MNDAMIAAYATMILAARSVGRYDAADSMLQQAWTNDEWTECMIAQLFGMLN